MKNLFSYVKKLAYHVRKKRSSKWKAVRGNHLKKEGWCRYCGGIKNLEVHHIVPFHINPHKELDETNLITLCEDIGKDCHLKIGHLGSWRNINPNVKKIANSKKSGIPAKNN